MIIIGADPGLWSGLAWWDFKMPQPVSTEVPYEKTGQVVEEWLHRFYFQTEAQRIMGDPTARIVIACEKYTMTPGVKTAQPHSLMGMGAIEYIAYKRETTLVWQYPTNAKKTAPDQLLRKLGWYVKSKDGHANDAIRHILLWTKINDPARFADMIGI